MFLFLLIFLAIYGAMNSYLFWKVFFVYPQLGHWRLLLAGFLALMLAGPFIAHYLEKWHSLTTARTLGFVIYSWAAVILWFVVLMAAVDAWNLCIRLAGMAWPGARSAFLPGSLYLPVIGTIVAVLLAYGAFQAQNVRVRRLTIKIPNASLTRPIKLAQISDLHLGEHMNPARLERICRLVRQEAPDVLISTGDMVDTSLENLQTEAGLLAAIQPPLGKYAVLGNHEFYNGLAKSLAFHDAAGFRVLREASVTLEGGVRLAGVDDPAGLYTHQECHTDESVALAASDGSPVAVLLKHQPRVDGHSLGRFVVQLSGHTHGGQVFPFHAVTRSMYHYYHGFYRLHNGSSLYVNLGAGTWGPPIRLGAQPEVTVITLSRAG